mgnify:CR=1 FL=1
MTKINSLRGMPDLYSDDLISWTSVENNLENIFKSYSLKELRTPILEYTDLFKRSVSKIIFFSESVKLKFKLSIFCLLILFLRIKL